MKKTIFILGLVFAVAFVSLDAQQPQKHKMAPKKHKMTKKTKKAPKVQLADFQGKIVSLNDLVMTGASDATPEKVAECAEKGQPLVFMSDAGQLYFLFDKEMKFNAKKLAEFAGKKITVKGKEEEKDGIKFIVVKDIAAVEA